MNSLEVLCELKDGRRWLHCLVYLKDGERLSDLMNDERDFIPLKVPMGNGLKGSIVSKDHIAFIQEM
jgi:hypothetical protein